jgi:hypothetical protein
LRKGWLGCVHTCFHSLERIHVLLVRAISRCSNARPVSLRKISVVTKHCPLTYNGRVRYRRLLTKEKCVNETIRRLLAYPRAGVC